MLNLSRRDFVVSTAMATALGLNGRLVVSPAFAQKTPDPAKGFVTYKVGAAEVTALYDGIWEKAHDPAFIANASVDEVKAAMVKAGLSADFVSIPFTVIVIKTGGKTMGPYNLPGEFFTGYSYVNQDDGKIFGRNITGK